MAMIRNHWLKYFPAGAPRGRTCQAPDIHLGA